MSHQEKYDEDDNHVSEMATGFEAAFGELAQQVEIIKKLAKHLHCVVEHTDEVVHALDELGQNNGANAVSKLLGEMTRECRVVVKILTSRKVVECDG